ncbi:MAG: hypothetical protein IIC10_04435 [Proteobacteria bacterium]|nr:hypothetical protein [Pseudomonadota bacterium]
MLRSGVILILAIFSLSNTLADIEFEESVPLELVKVFVGSTPFGEVKIYSDLLSAFPEFTIPDEFNIMGSIDRGRSLSVVLATELSSDQTTAALTQSFNQTGFTEFEVPGSRDPGTGFVRPNQPSFQANKRLCHDAFGFISFSYKEHTDSNMVTISSNLPNNNQSCAEQLAEQSLAMNRYGATQGGLRQYLPRLELPESEQRRTSPFFGMGSSSSSGNGVEARANVNVEWEIGEVFRHFKEQIEDQNWQLDSEIVGAASATGSWIHSPEPGLDLIGTLIVLRSSEGSFELKFQLNSIGNNSNTSRGVFLR